jgi:hypothetical protein
MNTRRKLVIEWRFADNNPERLAEFAADFVRLKVDAFATASTEESGREFASPHLRERAR